MVKVIFTTLLIAVILLPLKVVGLYFLWNEFFAKSIAWASPISWTQALVALLCFFALTFSLNVKS